MVLSGHLDLPNIYNHSEQWKQYLQLQWTKGGGMMGDYCKYVRSSTRYDKRHLNMTEAAKCTHAIS